MNRICTGCETGQLIVDEVRERISPEAITSYMMEKAASIDAQAEQGRRQLAAEGLADELNFIGQIQAEGKAKLARLAASMPQYEVVCPGRGPDGNCRAMVQQVPQGE